ncbi:MAG: hypothetical protein AAF547_23415 [Actinomycetota bacterium]
MADVNWRHGSLVTPPTPDAPDSVGSDDSIAALLDEAEDIINAAGAQVRADVDAERANQGGIGARLRRMWPFGK